MRTIKTTLFLLVLPLFTIAQYTEDQLQSLLRRAAESELVTENSQMLEQGYYYQAGKVADRLLQLNPESPNYNYRRGFIYLEMSNDFVNALPHLEKAVTDVSKNFDLYSAREQSASIDAIYHLGRAYHLNEDIDKAVEQYNRFLSLSSPKSEYVFFARLKLKQCEVAKAQMALPRKSRLASVGSVINTEKPEYSPVVSLDGSALYFTSRRPWFNGESDKGIDPRNNLHPEDIYVSYRDFDETWMEPVRMEFCDSLQNEATLAVSSDERRIYLYEDIVGRGDIFYSDFSTNKFQGVSHLETKGVNTEAWETHCTVTPDGQSMYFVSDRKGGFGGRDIYRVQKLPDGTWSEPVNLGPKINGPLDEESPFIAVDNKTLYFSSNGEKSMGGFDVFVSVRDENNVWSDAINLGYPLNSTGDDLFYTTTVDGLTGYLTSVRKEGKGEKDIYEIRNDYLGMNNLAVLKGKIITVGGKAIPEDVSITLRCLNCGDAFDRKVFPRIRDGIFLSSLDPCRDYEMIFSYENGEKDFYHERFNTDCKKSYDEVYREVLLDTDLRKIIPKDPYLLTGTVRDSRTHFPVEGARVTISYADGTDIGDYTSKKDGVYMSLPLEDKQPEDLINVSVTIAKEGYITKSYEIPITLTEEKRIDLDSYITPDLVAVTTGEDLGVLINLNPIYFDYNKSDIRPDAAFELDKIVKVMKENPKMTIELGSHTDARGEAASNLELSQRRAKSSVAYIVSKGIAAERLTAKGYGETKLVVSNDEINAMKTGAEKDAAHQKNRRTEFRIVKLN
jgi:outer membrane protein OmpA-like peptidoglycan-associated protein